MATEPIGTGSSTPPQPIPTEGPVVAMPDVETRAGFMIVSARRVVESKIVFYATGPDGQGYALPVSADDASQALGYAIQKSAAAWRPHPLPEIPAEAED